MARDMITTSLQAQLADLRRRLIDPDAVASIASLKRELTKAATGRMLLAHAASSLAGQHGSAEDLALAQENEKAFAHKLDRAQRAIGTVADAAVPELRAIAQSLAEDAAELAALLKEVGQHVADHGRRQNPTHTLWPTADASARGLAVLARNLGTKP